MADDERETTVHGNISDESPSNERKSKTFSTSSSTHASAQPFFFGNFIRSCGRPSNEDDGRVRMSTNGGGGGSHGDGTDGCFGIKVGGGGNKIPVAAEKDENEDDPTAVIAHAMNTLSVQEREQAYEDMHGVSAMVRETSHLIAESLHQMEYHIQRIHHKPAYDLAVTIRGDYVHDPKLRLMFLRADRFDPELAAKRLTRFMDMKLKLFGHDRLCQGHIGIDDLDDDARFMVESGMIQILPSRDSRGRVVIVGSSNDHVRWQRTAQSTLQMVYYTLMCASEDETSQKMGAAAIVYGLGQEEHTVDSEKRNSVWGCTNVMFSVPLRLEVTHFCMNNTGFHFSMVAKAAGLFDRARFRVHIGSHMECTYVLLSFGLPSELLPFTPECELKTGNHTKWIQRRIFKEHELRRVGAFSGIDLPSRNDVLLGHGKPNQNHPGNQRLKELCEISIDEYNQADRQSKTKAAARIIREILHPSNSLGRIDHNGVRGRFLKRQDCKNKSGWWVEETDDDVLIDKVCNKFRTVRKMRRNDA
jgi:hypothetical protein